MLHAEKEDYLKLDDLGGEHHCADAIVAVAAGHLDCLKRMTNDQLLWKDGNSETALHQAARQKHVPLIKYLLDRVPLLKESVSGTGDVPVLISAAKGDQRAVELLLGGALRDTISSALHRDLNGTSVLMAAVARGDNPMAAWLLQKFGKSLAILPNNARMLPIHVAATQGNLEFLKMVVKFDNQMVNYRDEFGCTACVYAVQAGCLSCVRFLVEGAKGEMGSVSNRGQSLLHIACLCGHEHVARWILHRTGNDAILWTTKDQANAVHCAAFSGSSPVLHVLLSSFSRRRRRSILSSRDVRGNTALHLAAINNHTEAAEYLLESGADVQLVNAAGHSAVGIAGLRGFAQMEQILRQNKGKKNKKSSAQSVRPAAVVVSPPLISPRLQSSLSPRDQSSGYSSAGEVYAESVASSQCPVERRRMKFVDDDSDGLKECAAQTDDDLLNERIQVLDDAAWAGLGLSAVAHIDRVLDEIDIQQLSPSEHDL